MRENRTCGSEGGETGYSTGLPYPYSPVAASRLKCAISKLARRVTVKISNCTTPHGIKVRACHFKTRVVGFSMPGVALMGLVPVQEQNRKTGTSARLLPMNGQECPFYKTRFCAWTGT